MNIACAKQQVGMDEPTPKCARLSTEEVLLELDDIDDPLTWGSDDEFSDITYSEKERDEWGAIDHDLDSITEVNLSLPHSTLPSLPTHEYHSPNHSEPEIDPVLPHSILPPVPTHTLPQLHSTNHSDANPPTNEWTSTLSPIDIAPFVENVGPTLSVPRSELEVFSLFFTEEIFSFIVGQTNMYAQQVLVEKYEDFEEVSVEELKAYFGFMILTGLVSLPALDDYWRRDPLLHYGGIADRISRQRFRELNRYLHFCNNQDLCQRGNPGYDRLGKVRKIMEKLQERFLTVYQPHCEIAIDEAMIPFQGRSSLKQYMPKKPIKRGIKVWCRADSHIGYVCEVQVYTGRADSEEHGLGKRVVLDLVSQLEGRKHHIYFDNFFNSVSLLTTLREKGLYGCGTARQNYKEYPEVLKIKGKSKRELATHGLVNR